MLCKLKLINEKKKKWLKIWKRNSFCVVYIESHVTLIGHMIFALQHLASMQATEGETWTGMFEKVLKCKLQKH